MVYTKMRWIAYFAKFFVVILFAALTACIQKYPISYYAAPGDRIVLGLGGVERNSGGANLTATDLTITLTNNSTQAVTTLINPTIFKAFPDYSSGVNQQGIAGALPVVPFDGGWFVSIQIPASGISAGAYTVKVTSPTGKLVNTQWCSPFITTACEGDLNNIPLQIISGGNSTASDSYAQQFTYYPSTGLRLDVSPNPTPAGLGYTSIGGAQVVINFPSTYYDTAQPAIVVPYSHNPSIQLAQRIIDNGNGTKSLIVLLSAQDGFVTSANRTSLTPVLSDLSLSLLYFQNQNRTAAQILADFQVDLNRSHYYDIDGNVISQLTPRIAAP